MGLLFALLGNVFGTIGPAATAAEPPLPLSLDLWELDPASRDFPELDPLWRVRWFVEPAEELPSSAPPVFRWPVSSITLTGERFQVEDDESGDPYYTGRLELGYSQLRKMEDEPRFMPALARLVFGVPTGLIEALTYGLVPDSVVANDRQVFDQVSATEDFASIMGRSLMMAEMKFYASIPRSYLWKFGAQNGTEDLDSRRLNRYEVRAFFSGMKNAYRERFRIPGLDLDTVLSTVTTGDWVDVFIVPAAVSLFAARFGIDRKIRIADELRVDLQIEKGTRFQKVLTGNHAGRLVSASVNLFRLPLSVVVSFGADRNSHVGMEFIGLGTDINAAICMLYDHQGSRDLLGIKE